MGRSCRTRFHLSNVRIRIIFITDKIGGSLSISLETLADHREIVLTSTKRCPHFSVNTKTLENNNSVPCHTGSTSNGNRPRVLNPLGGNGVDPGGLPKNSKKVNERGCMQKFTIERGSPLSLAKTSDEWLSRIYSILLQIDRLQLTAV